MKVYISVDSEGQACVVRDKRGPNGTYGTWQAELIRRQATREAAAAVEGVRAAGADDILVHDCGFIRNSGGPAGQVLYYEDLPRGVRIALGGVSIGQAADAKVDAAFLLGRHAMAGVTDGVMAHTYSSVSIAKVWLNGREIGEIGIQALQLGALDIPVVMVAGDEAACREAREWLGDVEVAVVKTGVSAHAAISLHPADACDLIRAKAGLALQRLNDFVPLRMDPPCELRIECVTEDAARHRAERMGATMAGSRTLVKQCDDALNLW